jgi:hypothetical protein
MRSAAAVRGAGSVDDMLATSFAFISAILFIYIPKSLAREVAGEQSHVHRTWLAFNHMLSE